MKKEFVCVVIEILYFQGENVLTGSGFNDDYDSSGWNDFDLWG